MIALAMPFEGLPLWAQTLFYVAFVVIVCVVVWTTVLFASSRRAVHEPEPDSDEADAFLWVFLVPALNEAVTIADSVTRLLAVETANKIVLVIDDGSTDETPAVLDAFDATELETLRRDQPDAQQGKAAALNAAWRHIETLLSGGRWENWPRDRIITCVVDADGRLDPGAPRLVAPRFSDERVGGAQILVRIYNRNRLLTWFQDVEFSIYGLLYQAGRTPYGAAGMGGNGQFNRLSAIDSIVESHAAGPWQDKLTEDQDLGLRLLEAGWRGVAVTSTSVDQQGPVGVVALLRQRTRWAQGNLQAMRHLPAMTRLQRPWLVRLDQVAYLLTPAFQALIGIAFLVSIVLWVTGVSSFWGDGGWWQLMFFFILGAGGVTLGCIARGARSGVTGLLCSLLIIPAYAAYSWLLWPALARAALRQTVGRREWAKTAHEPIENSP